MNFFDKMEHKFGKIAIPNLSLIFVACNLIGILFNSILNVSHLLSLNPARILHGEVWRLFTWVFVSSQSISLQNFFMIAIMLYFYYSIGTSLERAWGRATYNFYMFLGLILNIVISFGFYFALKIIFGAQGQIVEVYFDAFSSVFSIYHLCMSIFWAYAATFPDSQVLFMFMIPLKVKWLGIAYAALFVYEFIFPPYIGLDALGTAFVRAAMIPSVLVFVIFYLLARNGHRKMTSKAAQRRREYDQAVKKARPKGITRHKCAICGRTEETNPELEFRFCSKCNGNYEYCQEHLFTHTHVK